jgi:hypothetical protein
MTASPNFIIDRENLRKISVKQDLKRMVVNYFLMEGITENQCDSICNYIDKIIGGVNLPEPVQVRGCYVIPFPTTYTGQPKTSADIKQETKPPEPEPKKSKPTYYAPYGTPLPEGIKDIREALQRDGLALICYQIFQHGEGFFYNVLWAQSCVLKHTRRAYWSGAVSQDDIYSAMPCVIHRNTWLPKGAVLLYTVCIAPEGILDKPYPEYSAYIQSLKDAGMKNDFDYLFNAREQEHRRFIIKNKELAELNLSMRVIGVLDREGIHTIEGLKKLTVQKLRGLQSIGELHTTETVAILRQAGITLKEK